MKAVARFALCEFYMFYLILIRGIPVDDVYHVWAPSEPNDVNCNEDCVVLNRNGSLYDDRCFVRYPFICKKTLASLEWNTKCNMPNLDYKANTQLGRCYKFHTKPMNWTDAYAVCYAEQSYLAVINNQVEADYLVALTASSTKIPIPGDYLSGAVHLGFHNMYDEGWQTVKASALEDSGYTSWSYGQPDGPKRGVEEKCGTMFYDGRLNDLPCDTKSFFICEHDLNVPLVAREGETR